MASETIASQSADLYTNFTRFIGEKQLLQKEDKVLLAISGGIDSMAMLALFGRSPYKYIIAHCNFSLRGEDADQDQALVEKEAKRLKIKCLTKCFDTQSYASTHKLSIQMAARELRYNWLEQVRKQEGCSHIATAHHLDDAIETMLINLVRGTGIAGLQGIPVQNQHIIRPLLFASRHEIEDFVRQTIIPYREDASNQETKYLRNKIRHHILPVLSEINPSLATTMGGFFEKMRAASTFYDLWIEQVKKKCVKEMGNETHIILKPLLQQQHPDTLMYEFLKHAGFSSATCHDIFKNHQLQTGKSFSSATHQLLKDRGKLILRKTEQKTPDTKHYLINKDAKVLELDQVKLSFEITSKKTMNPLPSSSYIMVADMKKLQFPLLLRPWTRGDKMIPLGMKGYKKVSDMLTDLKIPRHKKKDIMVLESAGRIAWLVGLRIDERFKVSDQSSELFVITRQPDKGL